MSESTPKKLLLSAISIAMLLFAASSLQAKQKKCKKEDKLWNTAHSESTIGSYRDFLKACPKSQHAQEAREELVNLYKEKESSAFAAAVADNTYQAYSKFISSYNSRIVVSDPHCAGFGCPPIYNMGRFEDEAKTKMESLLDVYLARVEGE